MKSLPVPSMGDVVAGSGILGAVLAGSAVSAWLMQRKALLVSAQMMEQRGKAMSRLEKALLTVVQELIGNVERLEFQVADLSKRPSLVDLEVAKREADRWKSHYEDSQKELATVRKQRDEMVDKYERGKGKRTPR
jgi:hypothetical protein